MNTALPGALNNADLINEVMPFWYTLKVNAKTQVSSILDLYTPANPSVAMIEPLTALRRAGIAIIPTITDGTAKLVLANLLASPVARTRVINNILELVNSNNYDGIDIDFEGFAFVDVNTSWNTTAPFWIAFIKELSAGLHVNNKILSISSPYVFNPADKLKGYYVYSWAAIAPYIDRLRIMTYDYSVANPGPIGPISWVEKTVKYAVSILPPTSVYVGIAGYGRDWVTKVDGICPANVAKVISPTAKAATFVMRNAASLAASYNAAIGFNDSFGEANFTYQKVYNGQTSSGLATSCTATRVAWYQNAKAYSLRAALVSKYRLGGVAAWTLGMEEPLAMEGIRQVAVSIAPDQIISTLTIDQPIVAYGKVARVTGIFTFSDERPVDGIAVRLESLGANDVTWRTMYTGTADKNGQIAIALLLGKSASLRWASDATWDRAASLSLETPLEIQRVLSITAPGSVKSGAPFSISGAIAPRTAGISLSLKRWSNGTWSDAGVSVLTDSQGAFTLVANKESRGIIRYQIVAAADPLWSKITSTSFSILVR